MDQQTVIIQGDRIIKVVPSNQLKLSPKNNIIDGKGKFLIPGLWDAHVHFAYIEELAPSMFKLFLAHGITSVRDTGGKVLFVKKWRDLAKANPGDAPRVKFAGPLIDGMPNVYDGSSPDKPPLSVGMATVEEALKMVDYLDSLEVDLVKAYEMLTPEQFTAIVDHAQKKGLKVTGHIPLSMDAITAAQTGINSMEHLRNLEMTMANNFQTLLDQRKQLLKEGAQDQGGILRSRIHNAQRYQAAVDGDTQQTQKVLQALAENKVWQVPTLILGAGNPIDRNFTKAEQQANLKYLPSPIEEQWRENIDLFSATPISENSRLYSNWMLETVQKMKAAEVGIMAGTDCPIFFLLPGYSLHSELEMLVRAGLQPLEALQAATLNPASYFEMQDELGLIKENFLADLLILDANPLENISNTQKINAVIRNGKLHDRAALDQMLKDLEE